MASRPPLGPGVLLYICAAGVLAGIAFRPGDGQFSWLEVALLIVLLPAGLAALPIAYGLGAAAWSVNGGAEHGSTWIVTAVFVALAVITSAVNAWLYHLLFRHAKRRRDPNADQLASH